MCYPMFRWETMRLRQEDLLDEAQRRHLARSARRNERRRVSHRLLPALAQLIGSRGGAIRGSTVHGGAIRAGVVDVRGIREDGACAADSRRLE